MENFARSAFGVRCVFASLFHRACNLIPLRRLARNIISYCDTNKSDLRRVARRIRGRSRDDDRDVIARDTRRGHTARHHRRSPFGLHSAGSVSFAHGQGRRLQSSQATWRWIDNCRSTCGRRDRWSDFRVVRAAHSRSYPGDLDDVDLRSAAGRCICDRTVAGAGHKLHRSADSGRAARHTHRLRTVRPFVRTNASNRLPISDGTDGP